MAGPVTRRDMYQELVVFEHQVRKCLKEEGMASLSKATNRWSITRTFGKRLLLTLARDVSIEWWAQSHPE